MGQESRAALFGDSRGHPSIDEEEQQGHSAGEGCLGPVGGGGQVVFQMQAGETLGFGDQSLEVLVVPVASKVG